MRTPAACGRVGRTMALYPSDEGCCKARIPCQWNLIASEAGAGPPSSVGTASAPPPSMPPHAQPRADWLGRVSRGRERKRSSEGAGRIPVKGPERSNSHGEQIEVRGAPAPTRLAQGTGSSLSMWVVTTPIVLRLFWRAAGGASRFRPGPARVTLGVSSLPAQLLFEAPASVRGLHTSVRLCAAWMPPRLLGRVRGP